MIRKPVEPVVTDILYRRAAQRGLPISGTFELTPLCNMDCKMCYVRLSKAQQTAIRPLATAEQWLSLGKRCADRGMLYLLLTGGEPFSHPQIQQIITGLSEMGLILNINTNGTLIDEDVIRWLKKAPPARINVTLYGASDATYERFCGQKNGFFRAKNAVLLLKKAGVAVKINSSITPDNVHDLPEIVSFCRENDLLLQTNTYMFPPLRQDQTKVGTNFRFSPEDAAYHAAVAELLADGEESFRNRRIPCMSDSEECGEIGDGIRCRAGRCSFWVTWEGKMLPCGMFTMPHAPNVFDGDFDAAWASVKEQTAQIRLPAQCTGCGYMDVCRACAAMVYTESGNFSEVPKYRCEMAHAFLPQRNRLMDRINMKLDWNKEKEDFR